MRLFERARVGLRQWLDAPSAQERWIADCTERVLRGKASRGDEIRLYALLPEADRVRLRGVVRFQRRAAAARESMEARRSRDSAPADRPPVWQEARRCCCGSLPIPQAQGGSSR